MEKHIYFIFPKELVSYVKKKKNWQVVFILRAGREAEWERIIASDRWRREKGVRSYAQVDRLALDMNLHSSSDITRQKTENLL